MKRQITQKQREALEKARTAKATKRTKRVIRPVFASIQAPVIQQVIYPEDNIADIDEQPIIRPAPIQRRQRKVKIARRFISPAQKAALEKARVAKATKRHARAQVRQQIQLLAPIIPAPPAGPLPPIRQNQYGPTIQTQAQLRGAMFRLRSAPIRPATFNNIDNDSFRGFKRNSYALTNVGSLEGLYNMANNIRGDRTDKSAILRFINAAQDTPKYITVNPGDMFTFDDFVKRIDTISKGEVNKSDAIGEGNFIDTSYLGTISFDIYGEGKISKPFFVIEDEVTNKDSLCLWRAVFSQIEYDEARPIPRDMTRIKDFDELLRKLYNKSILCYGDWTDDAKKANTKYEKHVLSKENEKYMINKNPNIALAEIDPSELCIIYNYQSDDIEKVRIVYYDEHFIQYKGIKPGKFYFDHKKRLLRMIDGIIVEERTRQTQVGRLTKEGLVNNIPFTTEIVCFDVETRYDEKYIGLIRPYSISWTFQGNGYFYMGDDCVERMINFLMANQSDKLFCLLGYNSSRFDNIFLLPALLKMDMLTDVFYQNNSILNIKWGGRHTVHDICRFTLSSLERACAEFRTIFQKVGGFNHEIVQIHYNKYGNINTFFHEPDCEVGINENRCNGKIYKVPYMLIGDKKDDIEKELHGLTVAISQLRDRKQDFSKYENMHKAILDKYPQRYGVWYDNVAEVKNAIVEKCPCKCDKYNKLITYNLFDVFSTEELYLGIECVMKENKAIDDRLFDSKTIGSIIYKLFTKDVARRIKLPLMDLSTYKRVRSGLFAGRTQCYKGVSYDLSRKNKYVMLDVKSLYPYAMLNRYFPAGEIIPLSFRACMAKELIGFYNCRINQSKLNKNVIPLRSPEAPLDWTFKGDITVFINTVDIKCLIDAGADVEILKVDGADDGFVFSEKVRGDDLFNCLNKWKKIKEEQDILKMTFTEQILLNPIFAHYKAEKDRLVAEGKVYNVVLRNMAKTFLNALSGKVIENIHLDTTKLVRNKGDMEAILKNGVTIGDIQLSAILTQTSDGNGVGLITYKRKEEDEFKRQNRPIYLGTLIYAYARDHMYRSVLANYDVIYQDTDSALLSFSEYERFKQEQPDLLGDDFGKFALEDFSELFDSYITLSPKNYFIMGEKNGKYTVIKKGFKGVNLTRDKYINNPADYCWHIAQTPKKNGDIIYDIATNKGFDLYYGNIDYSLINDDRAKFDQPPIVAPKTVYDDWKRFVDDILEKKHAYVLTSSLNKTLRNVGTSGIQAGGIYQRFLLKKININLDQATLPFEAPANELLRQIHNGRHTYEKPKINDNGENIPFVNFNDRNVAKFVDKNILRTDLGGDNGNRAFNFDSYDRYIKSGFISRLMKATGQNFNLNEYPSETKVSTRLWLDIDIAVSEEKVNQIRDFIDSVINGGDNKILQSTSGKLHIILNIAPQQPIVLCKKVKKGRKFEFVPTSEYSYDDTPKGRFAVMLFFKKKLREIMANDTYDEEWDKAFDMKAKGMRAAYSIKMKAGKRISRGYYAPIDMLGMEIDTKDKCAVITDCSIYKPITGSIKPDLYREINDLAIEYDKKEEARKKKLIQRYAQYKYDATAQTITKDGIKQPITQKFIDEMIGKLSPEMAKGFRWRSTMRNIAQVSLIIPKFNNEYALHKWSATCGEYNKDRNNEIWDFLIKNARADDIMNSLYWLMYHAKY